MSLSNEDLEKTGLIRTLMDKHEDEEGSISDLDVIMERLEYMDIEEEKKKKYLDLIQEIKKEDDEKTREFLFHQLVKIVNKEG